MASAHNISGESLLAFSLPIIPAATWLIYKVLFWEEKLLSLEAISIALIALSLVLALLTEREPPRLQPSKNQAVALALLTGIVILKGVGYLASEARGFPAAYFLKQFLFELVCLIAFFYVSSKDRPELPHKIAASMLVLAIFLIANALSLYAFDISGPILGNKNYDANLLAICFFPGIAALIHRSKRTQDLKPAAILFTLMTAASLFTLTARSATGAWLTGVYFLIGYLIWHRPEHRKYLTPFILLPIGLLLAAPLVLNEHIANIFESTSYLARVDALQIAWEIFKQSPALGHGAGAYYELFFEYANRMIDFSGYQNITFYYHPHNILAQLLVETGAIGTSLFVALSAYIFLLRGNDALFLLSKLAYFVFILNGMTTIAIGYPVNYYMMWIILSMLLLCHKQNAT